MSKYKLSEDTFEKIFELSMQVIMRGKNVNAIKQTFFDILSPVERLMIAKRIAVMYLIRKGIDYHTICEVLKVSTTTIAKFVYLLERSSSIKRALDSLINDSHLTLFFKELFGLLYRPGASGINWKSAAEYHRKLRNEKTRGI